jgi:tRNA(fMet)-specific endonuclease VapC
MLAAPRFASATTKRGVSACASHFQRSRFSIELRYGAANSERLERNTRVLDALLDEGFDVVPFDAADAAETGAIRAHLRRAGTEIGPYDILIAGAARRRGATLATANKREFSRVPGLLVTDWAAR